jgi:hypothetical protein
VADAEGDGPMSVLEAARGDSEAQPAATITSTAERNSTRHFMPQRRRSGSLGSAPKVT